MDEFLIILGLFAILGFIVFALIRSALVGSFFYKTGFRKTGLPKEKYAEYVKGKKLNCVILWVGYVPRPQQILLKTKRLLPQQTGKVL